MSICLSACEVSAEESRSVEHHFSDEVSTDNQLMKNTDYSPEVLAVHGATTVAPLTLKAVTM